VLAMASLPEFDPNRIDEAGAKNMFNRVTNQVYELGSTFKPLTVAAAIDAGTVTNLGRRYPAAPLHMAGFTIHDDENLGPSINIPETLIHSSNIVSAQIADELGSDRMKRALERLHFNQRPYIELPARGFPIWTSGKWPLLRGMTVGYGHGIAVTPLHLATGYATLFNGGIYRPATLLKVDRNHPIAPGRRVFTEDTSYRMRALLREVVLAGTGKKADAPGYRVGGKTGTAEKLLNGHYTSSAVVTTFAGVFPMDEPRYVVVAMLDDPKPTKDTYGFHTAGWNVAPVVSRTISRIAPMLGVRPDKNREPDMSEVLPFVHDTHEE
jgi:cell division protein FtsI (penicillin-binding protein 3)